MLARTGLANPESAGGTKQTGVYLCFDKERVKHFRNTEEARKAVGTLMDAHAAALAKPL